MVDEHGGTAGIVTIQDVVEELIGEVQDEFDQEAPLVEDRDDGTYSVDGAARVDYLEEALGLRVPEEGFPTLGRPGVRTAPAPSPAWATKSGWATSTPEVLEVDGMRICRVLLTRLDLETGEDGELEDAESTERGDDDQED